MGEVGVLGVWGGPKKSDGMRAEVGNFWGRSVGGRKGRALPAKWGARGKKAREV